MSQLSEEMEERSEMAFGSNSALSLASVCQEHLLTESQSPASRVFQWLGMGSVADPNWSSANPLLDYDDFCKDLSVSSRTSELKPPSWDISSCGVWGDGSVENIEGVSVDGGVEGVSADGSVKGVSVDERDSGDELQTPPAPVAGIQRKKMRMAKPRKEKGAESHPCPNCTKVFGYKKNMTRHLVTSHGAKPYKCESCDDRFTFKKDLVAHVSAVHAVDPEYPHVCTVCSLAFKFLTGLANHRYREHGLE